MRLDVYVDGIWRFSPDMFNDSAYVFHLTHPLRLDIISTTLRFTEFQQSDSHCVR